MPTRRIILAGGSGFLGRRLAAHLQGRDWEPVILSRRPGVGPPCRELAWDGRSPGAWTDVLDGAHAVINLSGRSVNCRYTPRNRREILESRVDSTRVLGEAIGRSASPPAVWLNASTATIYRHTPGPAHDESSTDFAPTPEARDEFSVSVARAWEQAFGEAQTPRTRKVALRTSLVFGTVRGGVFCILRRLARFGLGGKMGNGRQYVSWIGENDFVRGVEWILESPLLEGPVNLAAPNPLTNAEMMTALRKVCGAPLGIGLPATRWMLELGAFFLRTETELLLKSRRVVPRRLLESGFQFEDPEFLPMIQKLESAM